MARLAIPDNVWLALPITVRQRWWRETNYGANPPSQELLEEFTMDGIQEILQRASDPDRDPLLATRQSTHGSFQDNAILSQLLKKVIRTAPGWERLTDVEREAMDMICLKFSRVLSGKSRERQHWEDIVGYGKLVEEQCV
jgi:hypothetical protein